MAEMIEVRYKPITTTINGVEVFSGTYHKYIIYTDSNGNPFYARGGPGDRDGLTGPTGGSGGGSFPFGDIVTEHGAYVPNTKDWNDSGTPHGREILITGDNLQPYWDKIKLRMDQIAREHHDYFPDQNSNTAADDALRAAGLREPTLDGVGNFISPGSVTGKVIWVDAGFNKIIDDLKNKFDISQTIVSPIVLDLNGDGITTTAVTDGAYFDHDANGFAEATGWVNPQDGILVLDRNGNGTIDTGRELFGSETLLADGQKAANGYQALAELDTNHDGQIDNQDAAYTTLQIWKDTNGDGYSSADELFTLADAGVQSIATGYVEVPHIIQQSGTYTRTDNSTGDVADLLIRPGIFNPGDYHDGILMLDTYGTGGGAVFVRNQRGQHHNTF